MVFKARFQATILLVAQSTSLFHLMMIDKRSKHSLRQLVSPLLPNLPLKDRANLKLRPRDNNNNRVKDKVKDRVKDRVLEVNTKLQVNSRHSNQVNLGSQQRQGHLVWCQIMASLQIHTLKSDSLKLLPFTTLTWPRKLKKLGTSSRNTWQSTDSSAACIAMEST